MAIPRSQLSARVAWTIVFGCFTLICVLPGARAAHKTATWIGGSSVNYGDSANWDINEVPLDNATDTFTAVIPASSTVNFDMMGTGHQVTQLTVDPGALLQINSGRDLEVLDAATIGGTVSANNSIFLAPHPSSTFTGTQATAGVDNAGHVSIAAPSYSSAGINSSATLFHADGTGSLLDLGSLQSLSAQHYTYGGVQVHDIVASNNGTVDLSSLQSVVAPGRESFDRIDFTFLSGGTIHLDALQSSSGTGLVQFNVHVPVLSLPSLLQPDRANFMVDDSNTVNLGTAGNPATQDGGGYVLGDNAIVSFEPLIQLNNAAITLGSGSQFNAPNLVNFDGSRINLAPGQTFSTGILTSLDNARIGVSGGVAFSRIAATSYASTGVNESATLFSAEGSGSILDLSSLTSINAEHYTYGGTQVHTIQATSGGVVDLSGVTQVMAPGRETFDRIDFVVDAVSNVDLSSLNTTGGTGVVRFDVRPANYSLPSLIAPNRAQFDVAGGSTLQLGDGVTPASQNGGTYNIGDNGVVNFGGLTTLNNVAVNLGSGSEFNAPNLTDFSGSRVHLVPGQVFQTGTLGTVNNARLSVAGGRTFGVVNGEFAATSYASTGVNESATLFSAEGSGSILDLSSLTSINAEHYTYGGTQVHTIQATSGGVVDLSGVTQVTAPGRETFDRIDFVAQTNGLIDLSSLTTVGGTGETRFIASDGGTLKFGDLLVTDALQLSVADNTSRTVVSGGLYLESNAALAVAAGASVEVGGNFSLGLQDESAFNADTGVFQFMGAGTRLFEVAGADLGETAASSNFGLARLIVGDATTTTDLVLVDLIDNGNRASPEALYLLGSGGLDGLQLLSGSTLMIGNIPVYALIDGEMTLLQSLFDPGETMIPYTEPGSDGFLIIPEPMSLVLLAMALLFWPWRVRPPR